MIILKNSEKFTVFKTKDKNYKNVVIKIALKKPDKIFREIKLIKKLMQSSSFFKKRIPTIIEQGYFKKGIYKNKGFYKQNFVPGLTFSEIIQNQKIASKDLSLILKTLIKQFLLPIRKSNFKKTKKQSAHMNNLIKIEYSKITTKNLLSNLEKSKNILINGKKYKNMGFYLQKVFKSKILKTLDRERPFLSNLGHWNFHGGNIIFPSKKNYKNFFIIDPDATWNLNDPFFSLARFVYTYPHDTMEYNKYSIYSDTFKKIKKTNTIKFKTNILWKTNIDKKYKDVFSQFYSKNFMKNILFDNLNRVEYLRFNLTLILCFIRGVNSNFESKINFLDKKTSVFQNKSIYLYLLSLIMLERFINHINYLEN